MTKKNLFVPLSALLLLLAACGRAPKENAQQQNSAQQAEAQTAEQQAQQAERQAAAAEQNARELQQKALQARMKARQAEQREAANGAQIRNNPQERQAPAQPALAIPAGTDFRVRLDQALDTSTSKEGDRFTATLSSPVVENGKVIVPQGTRFDGTVTTAESSGRLAGKAILALRLDGFTLRGRRYPVATTPVSRESAGHKKRDVGIIGGGAAAGAAIGGIVGGGKGAAIGAGAGAAAGTAAEAITGKLNVHIPAETLMLFKLESPVVLRS